MDPVNYRDGNFPKEISLNVDMSGSYIPFFVYEKSFRGIKYSSPSE